MSTDPKIEKLIAAMKTVPEKLATKWIEVTDSTNARIAEFEKSFADKEKEFKKVVDKLANKEQILADLKDSTDKIIAEKDKVIQALNEEIKNLKEKSNSNAVNNEFLSIVNKFISDISTIIDGKPNKIISEVKPTKKTETTVISDPVQTETKTEKKKTETKKETTVTENNTEKSDDQSVDEVLADLGITNL